MGAAIRDRKPPVAIRSDLTQPNEHSPERQTSHCEHCARNRSSSHPTTDSTTQMLHHHAPSSPLISAVTDRQPPQAAGSRIQRGDATCHQHHNPHIDNMR